MISKKKIIFIIIGLIVLIGLYFVFFNKNEKVNYLTETARIGNIRQMVNATGEVSPVQLVNVGAQVSGQVMKLNVELGQHVKKGDLIAEIDSTTQVNELSVNKAKLESYKAQLISAKIDFSVAQKKYQREQNLYAKQATSRESLENAKNAFMRSKSSVTELESLINQAQINVNTSEVNLGYTKIVAPLTGTVVSVPIEEGQTVNSNQTAPTIVQIADLSQMQIKMQISEGDITKVKPGMKVTYTILSEPNKVYETTLKSVDPGLTTLTDGSYSSNNNTSNNAVYYYGKLVVSNDDGNLHIGMTTQNTIIVAEKDNVLIVPSIVIQHRDDKNVVQVLDNNQIVEKAVQVGLADSMNTQILSGLQDGEQVISSQDFGNVMSQGRGMRVRL